MREIFLRELMFFADREKNHIKSQKLEPVPHGIRKEFSNGNLQTKTDIARFATKFAVDPKLVKEYVQHLNVLKQRSQMRAAQRGRKSKQLRQKTFEEYEWRQLVLGGEISKLKVFQLDIYLDKHNLLTGKKALKDDKVKFLETILL